MSSLNKDVTAFIKALKHPLQNEIAELRQLIVNTIVGFEENIKWNGPNYSFESKDRITMKIQPPKNIQIIFHTGAKKEIQPENKVIAPYPNLLVWKENNRAVATFNNLEEISLKKNDLIAALKDWIQATI